MRWQQWLVVGSELLLGASCPGCGGPGAALCPDCRDGVRALTRVRQTWRPDFADLPPVWVAAEYLAPLDQLLVAHKDAGAWSLVRPLGQLAAAAARGLDPPGPPVLVPVPSDPAAVRARGYDHARALGRVAAGSLGWQWRPLLSRVRGAPDQAGQRREQRLAAQTATMRASPGRRRVVVLDDIVTTGATSAEAVRALRVGGHQVLGVVAICETPRRTTPLLDNRPVTSG